MNDGLQPLPGTLDRRSFLRGVAVGAGSLALGLGGLHRLACLAAEEPELAERAAYAGPRVILVRFGGGVRRQETIGRREDCWCPYFRDELVPRGTLFSNMELSQIKGQETSHGQGTLNLLTGKYDGYVNTNKKFLGERFEANVPTVFEYLRKSYSLPDHQTLIVNGEDRTDEEFYSFSNHHEFGVSYRSRTISLYRFKTFLLHRKIEEGGFAGKELALKQRELQELALKQRELQELEALDFRTLGHDSRSAEIDAFWENWRKFYGDSGLRNPRGDELLTELTVRALRELRPRFVIVNYQDPDYVHWGNANHYTWGIRTIDQGLRRLVEAVAADEEYRDNTIFCVVPDCGRDDNRFAAVPFQHHFGSRSAHELFCLLFGPGIARAQNVDRLVDQTMVTGTLGKLMGFATPLAEGQILEEAFA